MRARWLLLMLPGLCGLSLAPAAAAGVAAPDAVTRWIDDLGSPNFTAREQASRALEAAGPDVLPTLRKAAASDDPEVRRRADVLVRRLEAEELTRKVLAPTRVRLVYHDVTLREALTDLDRKTGFPFALQDTRLAFDRRVTLDTGDTTAWQAVDRFCRQAGLTQASRPDVNALGLAQPPVIETVPGVPAAQLQLQAQMQLQMQMQMRMQMQMQMQMRMASGAGMRPEYAPAPGSFNLVAAKGPPLPTCYAGAVRVRALPAGGADSAARRPGELVVVLEATAEPRLPWYGVTGLHVERAVDDRGQHLVRTGPLAGVSPTSVPVSIQPAGRFRGGMSVAAVGPVAGSQQTAVVFRKGAQPARVLRELSGALLAEVQTEPEAVLTVDNVLQAAGQTIQGKEGGWIKVTAANEETGNARFHVQLEVPPDVFPAELRPAHPVNSARAPYHALPYGQQPSRAAYHGLNLLDDQGDVLPLALTQARLHNNGATLVWDVTLTYNPERGQGNPARLVFAGRRLVTVRVPFTLTDVPLH
jgi:hypothetical protein